MKLAFVFPGQGSQSVGMLNAMADAFPAIQQTFVEASEALGFDLWAIASSGPEAKLNETEITQPAMLAAGVATWRVWESETGIRPIVMAGHSLGEYTALTCAGAFEFRDAIRLVSDRGRLMQSAVPAGQGAMAAIVGLDDDKVRELCEHNAGGDVLSPVNFNSPGQVVIAGNAAAVARAVDNAKAAGAKLAKLLPVSVPSHCALMHPAAEQMRERLAGVTIREPRIPVLHNVNVSSENNPDGIRDALVRQVESPVRWVETIQRMAADGVTKLVECGPGKVLAGLNKRIDKNCQTLAVYDPESLRAAREALA